MITKYDKAGAGGLAAAIGTILFFVLAEYGIQLGIEVQAAVITLLTAALVYRVPNKS